MSELVTYPSGEGGKNVVSDPTEWTEGGITEILNGGPTSREEDRPFILKELNIEQASQDAVYELVFYAGETGSEVRLFSKRFAKGQFPFTLSIQLNRTFPGGTRIVVKMMDSNGAGAVFFSIQYEADPGNVVASL